MEATRLAIWSGTKWQDIIQGREAEQVTIIDSPTLTPYLNI